MRKVFALMTNYYTQGQFSYFTKNNVWGSLAEPHGPQPLSNIKLSSFLPYLAIRDCSFSDVVAYFIVR